MKCIALLLVTSIMYGYCDAQYYLRGIVKDENGIPVYNAKIFLASKGPAFFNTGSSGAFGIPIARAKDSITFVCNGYETLKAFADTKQYGTFILKAAAQKQVTHTGKLSSLIAGDGKSIPENYLFLVSESNTALIENQFAIVDKYPETGFALNSNRTSYSNVRRFINNEMQVPPDAVRIEEMLNYFDIDMAVAKKNDSFTCNTRLTQCPWNAQSRLLFINLKAPLINVDTAPPSNLVFMLDVSGSMDHPLRLPLMKEAFKMLLLNMRDKDTVAIVTYGGTAGIYLQPTSCRHKQDIIQAVQRLQANGETPGEAAIRMAYSLAKRMYSSSSNNRIILATDGDFNLGQQTDKELEDLVYANSQAGIYLTCLGVGMGNYKNNTLEALAKKGNGHFAYIDNIFEAEKVLVAEFTKSMYFVANNANMHVYFDPVSIKSYRLMGFDNMKEAIENNSTQLDGGEVGSGHSITAVFEIELQERFSDTVLPGALQTDIAQLRLSYTTPANGSAVSVNFTVPYNFIPFNACSSSLRFAAAVMMFGGILKQTDLWQKIAWDDVLKISRGAASADDYAQQEFISLAEKAKIIYAPLMKKKKR